ncbi:protein FAR1-RELATED SEQUENCE 5-like [Silene latifolia]|uniref:protein FAR1-RELATED SEQUENCE 5-like n=1 Tax=Silene latifolia TaxID=37657 RepID=UPI003D77E047
MVGGNGGGGGGGGGGGKGRNSGGFAAHSSQLSYYSNYFLCSGFRAQISASSIFIVMSDPTSNVTSSSCNDLHVSAITSKDSNDIVDSTPHVEQHSVPSRVHQLLLDSTPGGSELWTRNVAPEFKPYIGQLFGTLEEAISFYDVYAEACGFEPRKSSQKGLLYGDVKYKFVVCNREGFRDRKRKATVLDSGKEQVNQGPTRAFRNVKEYVDGYENVGAQLVDFKNFGRDIKCFIGDRDAQLFVNYFEDKRDTTEGFYFAYEVDSGKCLVRAFWCDAESRRNYALFGDYIIYDPTYKRRISILGLRAVFKHAKRRYCMWHIMQKVTDKVGPAISRETDFVSRLNAIVWDAELEPLEFEEKWCQLVNEHNLDGNSWLSTMFRKRRKWIPTYFRDVPMGCLLRTTQRSESQNNFFKRFENAHGTLVEFLMRFQSAIDVQIAILKNNLIETMIKLPLLFVPLVLVASHHQNGVELIGIADARTQKTYQVVYNSLTNDAECSCKLFNRKGIICRHIIWVYSGKQVHTLPDKYILMRWTKNAHKIPLYGPHGELIEDFDATDLRKMEMCKLWSEFYATISVLKNVSTKEITDLVDTLKQFRVKLNPQSESMTKEQELEMLLGCSSSTEVRILPPRQAKNKGSGKRMISKKQQCIAKAEKPKRLCRNCKQMAHHDKRNCPNAFVPDADNKGSSDEDDADDG